MSLEHLDQKRKKEKLYEWAKQIDRLKKQREILKQEESVPTEEDLHEPYREKERGDPGFNVLAAKASAQAEGKFIREFIYGGSEVDQERVGKDLVENEGYRKTADQFADENDSDIKTLRGYELKTSMDAYSGSRTDWLDEYLETEVKA